MIPPHDRPALRYADVDTARACVLQRLEPLAPVEVEIEDAEGRVLSRELRACWDLPGEPRSVMDGWAVRAVDLRAGPVRIVGESAAGRPFARALAAGETVRISTGAVVPSGADAVVSSEDAEREDATLRVGAGVVASTRPGTFVRAAGSDVVRGALLLPAGTRLRAADLALLAAAGHSRIPVHRRPRIAIVSTGDELCPIGSAPAPGRTPSTNGAMLAAMATRVGATVVRRCEAGDDRPALDAAFARLDDVDVLMVIGGISVGDHDLVHAALADRGARFAVETVRLRPGKPLCFGTIDAVPVFALPGNPASVLVTFELFVAPALRRLAGERDPAPPEIEVVLASEAEGAGDRAHCVRARLIGGVARPLDGQGSGALRSISGADALILVPAGVARLSPGDRARAVVLEPWSGLRA